MISKIIRRRAGRTAALCLVFALGACTKAKLVKKPSADVQPAAQTQTGWMDEPDIHNAQFAANPELRPVHFGFDRYYLDEAAREILRQNAEVIKKKPEWEVLVEGHCDERGTVQYNLALGQKRAQVTRKYYLMLGIPGDRIATISYGEENPVCREATDECWLKNRRAEAKIKTPLTRKASSTESMQQAAPQ